MMNLDELYSMIVPQLLRFHGLRPNQCPLDATHELTVASDSYAVCHSCGIEWDIIGLHSDLLSMDTPNEQPTHLIEAEDALTSQGSVHSPTPETLYEIGEAVDITDDFAEWIRTNRQHIARTPDYDGDSKQAVGFVTLKGNLCLLPCSTDRLTYARLRTLEETWKRDNLIYPPKKGRGIKRSERIPSELRKVHKCSPTMKLYTFHWRETSRILEVERRKQPGRRRGAVMSGKSG